MTRKEFSSRRDALQRVGSWYGFGLLCLIFALLFVSDFLSGYLKQRYQLNWSDKAADILPLVIVIGAMV
ncbi:MAG TPA: hypothetical protein VGI88_13700, partial [Verrucomicrobiae bacterium]